jgi:hypothetical protein
VAKDSIEIGFGNNIPVWLFGFMYWFFYTFDEHHKNHKQLSRKIILSK